MSTETCANCGKTTARPSATAIGFGKFPDSGASTSVILP